MPLLRHYNVIDGCAILMPLMSLLRHSLNPGSVADESFEHIRRFWPVIPVFALFALFAMYFYQFDFVSEFLLQFLTARQLAQIGLCIQLDCASFLSSAANFA
jgi:hypothetical protein